MGVLKTGNGYEFFASDGGVHSRQLWQGEWVGNNKSGSVVTTVGTLDNPLGAGNPQDVTISPNPSSSVNPNYPSYGYMGGGPVYQVPAGMTGAGNLLVVYHAELPNDALYAALGLAESTDNGLHWTDLGEIIRLNQAYAVGLDGFEIGDGPLTLLSPPTASISTCLFRLLDRPTARSTPQPLLGSRHRPPPRTSLSLRVHWLHRCSRPLSDHRARTLFPSRDYNRAIGICNQP